MSIIRIMRLTYAVLLSLARFQRVIRSRAERAALALRPELVFEGSEARAVASPRRRPLRRANPEGMAHTLTDMSDIDDWIVRTGLGDRGAFDALYDATSAKLFGVCLRILNNRAEAEDALQDCYVRIWQKAKLYKSGGYSPMTWLITLSRNLAIDRLRARKAPTDDINDRHDLADRGPTPEDSAIAASERSRIDACLDELDDPKAGAVRGAYLMGETYDDLARRYDVPVNTMRTWLRRSLMKLRECLTR